MASLYIKNDDPAVTEAAKRAVADRQAPEDQVFADKLGKRPPPNPVERAVTTDVTETQQSKPWLFKPGQSGNPKGRPIGTRNKLGQDFINNAYQLWQEGGVTALRRMRDEEPSKFCVMIAGLIPHQLKLEVEHSIAGLSQDELIERLIESRNRLLGSGVDLRLLVRGTDHD